MKERPILFSGAMVRAILEGKTQTRRIVKPQPQLGEYSACGHEGTPWWAWIKNPGSNSAERAFYWKDGDAANIDGECPYGQPGDRLWVKETWAHYHTVNGVRRYDGRHFDEVSDGRAGYRADGHSTIADFREHVRMMSGCDLEAVVIKGDRWRPSIHMPRWASRITLEMTGVRVERLHDISHSDAVAEGCPGRRSVDPDLGFTHTPREQYQSLWEQINGPGSWEADPFVWVIEFKRVTP